MHEKGCQNLTKVRAKALILVNKLKRTLVKVLQNSSSPRIVHHGINAALQSCAIAQAQQGRILVFGEKE